MIINYYLVSYIIYALVIYIAFYINPQYDWSWQMVAAIGLVNYMYKFLVAIIMTPLLYGVHAVVDRYLGQEVAARLIAEASIR